MSVDYYSDEGQSVFEELIVFVREWADGLPYCERITVTGPGGDALGIKPTGASVSMLSDDGFLKAILLLEADNKPHLGERIDRWRATFNDIGSKIDAYCEQHGLLHFSQDLGPIESALNLDVQVEVERFAAEMDGIANIVLPVIGPPQFETYISPVSAGQQTQGQNGKTLEAPKPKVGADDSGTDDYIPKEDSREYLALQVLWEAKAFDAKGRVSAEKIAAKATNTDVNNFKDPLSSLAKHRLLEVKKGSGGGYWLTATGQALCRRLFDRENGNDHSSNH